MAIESWMRVNVADVNQSYVSNFLRDHKSLNQAFDPSRATSKDHAAALEQLSSLYGTVMEDGGLSDADRSSLSKLMTGSNQAFVDAYHDHNLASRYGVGLDVGYYEASDAEAGAQILAEAKAANADASAADPKTTTADATTASEPRRAADGRIIYDAAPSFEQVRAGNGSIGLGQKSDEIRDAQRALFEGGFYEGVYEQGTTADDVSDHFFGPKTEQAVQAWQKANGMEATGRLDGAALDKLLGGETAQVTTGAGNPSAQVTTGAANPSAQTFSVPAELQAEYDGVKAQVDAGVSGHRGRNLRNRLKSLEGQISQDGLATEYQRLSTERDEVAARLDRNGSGHTGRNLRNRLASLDAQLAELRGE